MTAFGNSVCCLILWGFSETYSKSIDAFHRSFAEADISESYWTICDNFPTLLWGASGYIDLHTDEAAEYIYKPKIT